MNASGRCQRERVSPRWGDRCSLWHWPGVFSSPFMAQSARGGQRAGPLSQALTPPALSRSRARGSLGGLIIRTPWPVRSRNSGVEGCSVAEPSQPESRAQPSWSLSWFVVFECVLDAISRQQHTVVTNPLLSQWTRKTCCLQAASWRERLLDGSPERGKKPSRTRVFEDRSESALVDLSAKGESAVSRVCQTP